MCYNLAPIWLQELLEGWQSLPPDCLRGSILDFQLEFTLLTFALPRHTQASAAICPIAGGLVRGHQAYPHTDGPACRTSGGQTSSESLQSRLGPCGARLTCVATRMHCMGLAVERLCTDRRGLCIRLSFRIAASSGASQW